MCIEMTYQRSFRCYVKSLRLIAGLGLQTSLSTEEVYVNDDILFF